MRTFIVIAVAFVLAAPSAPAAVIGTGSAVVIAGGNGVDLVLWRDSASGSSMAARFGPTGAALDAVPIQLPPSVGSPSAAAWDGTGFVIAAAGGKAPILRLPVSGGTGFSIGFEQTPSVHWAAVASDGAGSSLFVWNGTSGIFAASVSPAGDLLSFLPLPVSYNQARLVRDGSGYLLAHVPSCPSPTCPPRTEGIVQRLDDRGNLIGGPASIHFPFAGMTFSSLAEGLRPLLAVSGAGMPATTSLLSFDPGAYRAVARAIRFPAPLSAQKASGGQALIGEGARIDLSETGAPLTVDWAPLPDGQRLAGILPSSGARVLAPASGAGPISVEPPPGEVTEVGLAPVFVSASTVWLKVDNRGPDPARVVDVWLTGSVQSFSSLMSGTITRHGPLSRIRFEPTLKQGAGFEIAIAFEQPIDASAFEAWALTLGTDRDATNNYVTTRADEPEPEPEIPRRRRMVWR